MLGLCCVWQLNQWAKIITLYPRFLPCESKPLANVLGRFQDFDNREVHAAGAGDDALVPNVIHFVRMGDRSGEVQPEEAACISAALRTQPDATVVVHTDSSRLEGEAWRRLLARVGGGRLSVQQRPRPLHVFGLPIRDDATLHRVAALRILTKHGGVYVSNTAYLQADLSEYRRYECVTASTAASAATSPELMAAHRDARLPHRWLHHFHDAAFVWERRPPASADLCRDLGAGEEAAAVVVSIQGVGDPRAAKAVSPEDWYLWEQDPEPAGGAGGYDWLLNML